ncbi:hypothetical protein D049_3179A, partial [Vibrio parahaemolyticus VPTS-2010]
MRGQRYE